MKKLSVRAIAVLTTVLLSLPLAVGVREGQTQPPPPVESPIVREGDFAMSLADAFGVGQPASETEAESMLGAAGIAPRNGWIADYPVTPDIIGELRDSVIYAAQANTISMDVDAAIRALESVEESLNIEVVPGQAGPPETYSEGEECPAQSVINDYYVEEGGGPPIVTYCSPPPDYYYLYAWVPYPFWWGGFWFGGFFILHDFHRHFREHGHVFVVSNHFNDVRAHRVFRIDPVNRFRGKTFAGIGAPRSNRFISPGVQRAPERIFNDNRSRAPQGSSSGPVRQPSTKTFKANPFPENRVYSSPPGAARTATPRSNVPGERRTTTGPSGGGTGAGGR